MNAEPEYLVDDRGDRCQFRYPDGDLAGEFTREGGESADQTLWVEGGEQVKQWAIANGYPEVATMPDAD